ncbi:coiled-coil domain-containing protein 74A isoform X2 [Trichomycterus rosablanca]|uniref:coiled-coil domain-containing protein 74A isoform X2 n=1 Tax=Trichomycterus rosablanca TaxID=2290929 RepID=UPI002F35D394
MSWSRVGTLDCYPPAFPGDCLQKATPADRSSLRTAQIRAVVGPDRARIASLEKDLIFLQQTHKNTLEKLHEEIEHLKRANKELQYQLIMKPQKSSRDASAGALHENKSEAGAISSKEKLGTSGHNVEHNTGIVTSLLPLRIHDGPSRPPRVPTMPECESIIQQLYNANTIQSQELMRVKTILKDIVFNRKKISPHMFSEAKAFLTDNKSGDSVHFPKLSHKPLLKIQQATQSSGREKVILPAIRQTLNSLTERQKRAQDVHRNRLKRIV